MQYRRMGRLFQVNTDQQKDSLKNNKITITEGK